MCTFASLNIQHQRREKIALDSCALNIWTAVGNTNIKAINPQVDNPQQQEDFEMALHCYGAGSQDGESVRHNA